MDKGHFIFDRYAFDPATGALTMCYAYENGPAFEERVVFPLPPQPLDDQTLSVLDRCLRLIFLLAGVSYYKAYVPVRLVCRAFPLDAKTAAFIERVYRNGLGEFAFRNKLDLSDKVRISCDDAPQPVATRLSLGKRPLVPVGGGKDSIVTLEALKRAGLEPILFALAPMTSLPDPIRLTIETSNLPFLKVARSLSPQLAEVNRQGARNGHVPITSILSAIAVAAAIMHGLGSVVLSNEHSASVPNVVIGDWEINHQYSKSFAFEKDLASYIREHITPDVSYFSFLRPLTETAIVRRFAQSDAYDRVFRSCNTAFRQDAAARGTHWCCDCPKCRFVFLALANFVDKDRLLGVFDSNLLDNAHQMQGFAELCGLSGYKPFECVGTIEESAVLIARLSQNVSWKDACVVRDLGGKIALQQHDIETTFQALLADQGEHALSPLYRDILHAPL